jgi:hypothetical protein
MRIAYLVHWDRGPESGVSRKILAQATAWRRAGTEVRVVAYGRPSVAGFVDFLQQHGVAAEAESFETWWTRLRAVARVAERIRRLEPDLVYFRHDLWHPAIERLAQDVPLVVEVNSDDVAESRGATAARQVFHLRTRHRLLRAAAGAVFASEELSRRDHFRALCPARLVLGNGIDLEDTPLLPAPANSSPALVFVAAELQPWHGVDKLLWLASQRPGWRFELVGDLRAGRSPAGSANVTFHGAHEARSLREILARADLAVGSIALHRKGMDEASPLKTRECLASGLPVIIGCRDTDFPEGAEFLLQLGNREENVSEELERIDAFVSRWKGRRVPRSSVCHLGVTSKEARRLAFLEGITSVSAVPASVSS